MNPAIRVDLTALQHIADRLQGVSDELGRQGAELRTGATGDPVVDATLASVTRDWSTARGRLADYLGTLAASVSGARQAYQVTDHAVSRAAAPR